MPRPGPAAGTPTTTQSDPQAVPSYVPAPFVTLVKWAAGVIRVPVSVVAAQWSLESSFNSSAKSGTGAQGLTQIEPGTWAGNNCSGNPYDPTANVRCYVRIMTGLLAEEHGNIRNTLAAYNAGPGNLQAGYGYADVILSHANAGTDPVAGGTTIGGATGTDPGAGDPDCISWAKIPGVSALGFTAWPGVCFLHYRQARELIGAAVLVGGALVMGYGVQMLVGVAAVPVVSRVAGPALRQLGGAQRAARQGRNAVAP